VTDTASAPVPEGMRDLLTTDVLGHLATIRPDGSLAPAIVWVDLDGERILVSSPLGAVKGRNVRANPNVALSVVDHRDPFRYLLIRGRVTEIRPDERLAVIDRMSRRYRGHDYADREGEREVFVITPDNVATARW
jgi:PPOX class probable F420-dependent enzyme